MTEEEIEDLPVGDKIDLEIAYLLGLKNARAGFANYCPDGPIYWDEREGDDCQPCVLYDHPEYGECELPSYSANIACAWTVINKFEALGYEIHLLNWGNDKRGWQVSIESFDFTVKCFGRTAPLAICRAALLFSTVSF